MVERFQTNATEEGNPWDTPPVGEMLLAIVLMVLFLPLVKAADLLRAGYRCLTARR